MIVLGVTGNLSTGKSEVAKLLRRRGAQVLDADVSARKAVERGRPAYQAIVKIFGKKFLAAGGELNRKKLGEHVFRYPKDLRKLNILIHPAVILDAFSMIHKNQNKKGTLVIDAPLLYEAKMECLADFVIVVTASQKKIFERSRKKGIGAELARKILAHQWPASKKAARADFVIENNGGLKDLARKVDSVLAEIEKRTQHF